MTQNKALEAIVVICGAAVMILELTGSRVLAPYLGTSIFVWTSLIGIVLGCLSLGYHWGGKLSDKKPDYRIFSRIILGAACCVAFTAAAGEFLLSALAVLVPDIRTGAVLASLLLFGAPSILLGMVSPYAVRLKLTSVQNSGSEVGKLYALSTLGSIAGTFLAGFVLIAYFPNNVILTVLVLLLGLASFLARPEKRGKTLALILLGVTLMAASARAVTVLRGPDFIDTNTAYNRVWIFEDTDSDTGLPIRMMQTNDARSSAMFLDDHDLAFRYNRFYRMARHFKLEIKDALMIGGCAFSFPRDFLKKNPQANLDVVEIDPGLTRLAKKYFRLADDARLRIYHADGRIFLNTPPKQYDVYFGDAFTSLYSIPFHLTTLEAVRAISESLKPDGVALVNIISSIEGEKGRFLRAEYQTFKKVFPQVYLFPVRNPEAGNAVQNIILVALKSAAVPSFEDKDPEIAAYLSHLWKKEIPADMPVLTDAFSPVDRYVLLTLPKTRPAPGRIWEKMTKRRA